MIKIISLCACLGISVIQLSVRGQSTFNRDLYTPMPLQPFSPPKDTAYKENTLVIFDMLERKFDTGKIEHHHKNLNPDFSFESHEQANQFIKNRETLGFGFTDVKPADQIAGFPNYPMSAVVKLFLTFFNPDNNQYSFATCSGMIIEPGFIITGAHCVKSKFDASYAVECTVIPAYNLGTRPFGLTTTTNWYALSQWTENGNLEYDMAIMRLANPIGNTTGTVDWGFNPDTSFYTKATNVFYSFGYPGYDPLGLPVFEEGERMYYMQGFMDFWQASNTMCHRNIGYSGQSGSGLFYQDSFNNRQVHGVLSHGNLFPPYFTCHCRMDSILFNYFNSIISPVNTDEPVTLNNQIALYPNPTYGVFYADFKSLTNQEVSYQIFDGLGRQIKQEYINTGSSNDMIDLTDFPDGIYYLKANHEGNSRYGRIYKME